MSHTPLPRRTWTVREVAEMLGIPYETTLDTVKRDMRWVRAGRHYLVPVEEFERFLAGDQHDGNPT
ncbi:excisionase family DNA-binding protein [Pseudonocardia sp. WMMC193]|uniref:excisionase family DNA-binding protein n=1 Tax=Pseudonocardia sp. WMMC193 TaxID=2911965 RepID=UPI001F01F9BE|nr:excisionase family DNA-binding protein [Pseudonocardia sp. WMMC193]MCF7548887.1 excisionase family DNA-binding protein [Pseudonocardia sp. WMMC193]